MRKLIHIRIFKDTYQQAGPIVAHTVVRHSDSKCPVGPPLGLGGARGVGVGCDMS